MLRRSLACIAALLMVASLVFTRSTSAHNIDVKKARELVRDYARGVRDQSGGKYLHYSTRCTRSNPGHNHYVSCVVEYQNAKDKAAGVYTCKETLIIFLQAHSGSVEDYRIVGRHASNNTCGSRRLNPNQVLG